MAAALVVVGTGCADGDNPTALADLNPIAEFELEGTAETFREVEINVEVIESGARMQLSQARIVVNSASGSRTYDMEEDERGFGAHITFFEPGIHLIEMTGTPDRHAIAMDLGEIEILVRRYHEVTGPYWVEFSSYPAPNEPGQVGHLTIFVYDLLADSSRGTPVAGLTLRGELHHPDGDEVAIGITDTGDGEYEAEVEFAEEGTYGLNIVIDNGVAEFGTEFIFPVIDPDAGTAGDDTETNGGGGHG